MRKLLSVRAFEIGLILLGLGVWVFVVVVVGNVQSQLEDLTETRRKSELNRLQQALEFYYVGRFVYPDALTPEPREICNTDSETVSQVQTDCAGAVDLRLLVPQYIGSIPHSGQSDAIHTGYWVWISEETDKAVISRYPKKEPE